MKVWAVIFSYSGKAWEHGDGIFIEKMFMSKEKAEEYHRNDKHDYGDNLQVVSFEVEE